MDNCQQNTKNHVPNNSPNQEHLFPFTELVPDCRKLVLSYHYYAVRGEDLPTRKSKGEPQLSPSNLKFALNHFHCYHGLKYDFLDDMPLLSNLRSVRVLFSSVPLDVFSHFKNIKELRISNEGVFRDEMFQHLGSLEVLYISRNSISDSQRLTDEIFSHLKNLRELDLIKCVSFTDRAIENLHNSGSRLRVLKMSLCHGITDESFSLLASHSLRELIVWFCKQITGEGLKKLPRGIETLELSNVKHVDGDSFKCLEGSAQSVKLSFCTIPSFDDNVMSFLKGASSFELCSSHLNLTDAGFSHLAGSIRKIDIRGCNGVKMTKDMLWHLRGIHKMSLFSAGLRIESEDIPRLKEVFRDVSSCRFLGNFADDSTLAELRAYIEGNGGRIVLRGIY